jgi:hypothetical protein
MLLSILDKLRDEANGTKHQQLYQPTGANLEAVNMARSRAFIHLFLKVSFGLLEFGERESFVTDGAYDGGIDGYYIHSDSKTIFLIQSKFRTTERNFEEKEIDPEEILVMDVDRIIKGEQTDENGNRYNGKIQGLQRRLTEVEEIGRYSYKVVIIANNSTLTGPMLKRLTGGFLTEVFDFEKCYSKLVFPVLSGTFFNASSLHIAVDLSNKSAGAKVSYSVTTAHNECQITVLFVPTSEIARILSRYKNSILQNNPRSYLELEGKKVNTEIRKTILGTQSNEFALLNNGITILSDETVMSEKVGQRNRAQLILTNPQIINGGQTAYTLSRILEELSPEDASKAFENKEVLLKIITLVDSFERPATEVQKAELVEKISTATNQQTVVIAADRHSNDAAYIEIQKTLFDRYGLLYERKRGEFADGLHKGYITATSILERNLFFRIYLASLGEIDKAVEKKLFLRFPNPLETLLDLERLDTFYFAYLVYVALATQPIPIGSGAERSREIYGKVYACVLKYLPSAVAPFEQVISSFVPKFINDWQTFVMMMPQTHPEFLRTAVDAETGSEVKIFQYTRWRRSKNFPTDIEVFFGPVALEDNPQPL